jgi:hypothetical protein
MIVATFAESAQVSRGPKKDAEPFVPILRSVGTTIVAQTMPGAVVNWAAAGLEVPHHPFDTGAIG